MLTRAKRSVYTFLSKGRTCFLSFSGIIDPSLSFHLGSRNIFVAQSFPRSWISLQRSISILAFDILSLPPAYTFSLNPRLFLLFRVANDVSITFRRELHRISSGNYRLRVEEE